MKNATMEYAFREARICVYITPASNSKTGVFLKTPVLFLQGAPVRLEEELDRRLDHAVALLIRYGSE